VGESYDLGEDLKELDLRTSHSSHASDVFVSDRFCDLCAFFETGLATALRGHNFYAGVYSQISG